MKCRIRRRERRQERRDRQKKERESLTGIVLSSALQSLDENKLRRLEGVKEECRQT